MALLNYAFLLMQETQQPGPSEGQVTGVKIVALGLAVVLVIIIVLRRMKKKKSEDEF